MNYIQTSLNKLGAKGLTPSERKSQAFLRHAESLYVKAINEIGKKDINGKIIGINNKDDKIGVAKEIEMGYNKKYSILWENLSKQEQAMLYERIDHMRHLNYTYGNATT